MMNTAHTQSEQSVFERQRHSANGQQPRGGVWQDNPTPHAARTASPQPAPRKKVMRSYSSRIAMLLVRVAFASEQTRGIVTNILGRQPGVTSDVLTTILDGSSNTAKGNITRKTPQLTELMDAVEHWMRTAEEEGQI